MLVQVMLWVDRSISDETLPRWVATTVESGRVILSTVAGGLIASITLLLSLMLVAIQLGNSQFSPRTLRDWIGDRVQQRTIGVVLGTTVFCLLALRRIRDLSDVESLAPDVTVLVAVALGVLSLVAVVYSVDHLADSLRVGAVAGRVAEDTRTAVREQGSLLRLAGSDTVLTGATHAASPDSELAAAVESTTDGWVQQISVETILDHLPEGATATVAAQLGDYVFESAPLLWVVPEPEAEEIELLRSAFAVGDSRTMQQDIGFGILQMVDVALRALSPGINDPNTANDMIGFLGSVMLSLWEQPLGPRQISRDGRTVHTADLTHSDYLHAAFDQIRRHSTDLDVAATAIRTLQTLRSETERRDLAGPVRPIDEVIDQIVAQVEASDALDFDKRAIRALVS